MQKPKFEIGQKVIYTNPQGVCWGEKKIINIEYWETSKEPRYFLEKSGNPAHYSVAESCCTAINPTKPARVLVKVTCNTGKNWTTQINGDLQNATAYLMGQLSVDECEITGKETRHVVTKVEEVQA